MKVALVILVVVMVVQMTAGRGVRVRRGFNSSGYTGGYGGGGSGSGYGRGSDERDASVSQESQGCGNGSRGYGNNSGSRESSFKDGRDSGSSEHVRGGRAFARATAAAHARTHQPQLVEVLKPGL